MPKRNERERERLAALAARDRAFWDTPAACWPAWTRWAAGPLAGPVVVCCAVMPPEPLVPYVNDSKKLTPKRREAVFRGLTQQARAWSLAFVGPEVVDDINILEATRQGFREAFASIGLPVTDVLIDALGGLGLPAREHPLVHGDALFLFHRRRVHPRQGLARPVYGGAGRAVPGLRLCAQQGLRHGGAHRRAARPRPLPAAPALVHREVRMSAQSAGRRGERLALRYLRRRGYRLLQRNYRHGRHEIDLVMQDGDCLVFVEVKARSNIAFGTPAMAVGREKQRFFAPGGRGVHAAPPLRRAGRRASTWWRSICRRRRFNIL